MPDPDPTPTPETPAVPAAPAVPGTPDAPAPPLLEPVPFTTTELRGILLRPHRAIDLILALRERWTATVADQGMLGLLILVMLGTGILYALPYGAIFGLENSWRVAALFFGSCAICLPSLHVFGSFLGLRVTLGQSLAFAALVATVAAIFTLGFAPILWFLDATMEEAATVRALSTMLLILALLAGMFQLSRCVYGKQSFGPNGTATTVLLFWHGLLLFITVRMGDYLNVL